MRGTQFLEYLKMDRAPNHDEEVALTHITLTEKLKKIRKDFRKKSSKKGQLDINGDENKCTQ